MFSRIRCSIAAAFAVAAIVMICAGTTATAQILWNPPCGAVTIFNNTPCTIGLCPGWAPMLAPPCSPFILPGNFAVVPTAAPALMLNGIFSQAGILRPLVAAPPAPPSAVPAPWWVPNIMVGPAPGCCVDVYIDNTAGVCTMWVFPTRLAPPCRP